MEFESFVKSESSTMVSTENFESLLDIDIKEEPFEPGISLSTEPATDMCSTSHAVHLAPSPILAANSCEHTLSGQLTTEIKHEPDAVADWTMPFTSQTTCPATPEVPSRDEPRADADDTPPWPSSILSRALTSRASSTATSATCAGNIVADMKPADFSVDRRRIQAVNEAQQPDELRSLGLSVYDQSTLEQGILQQVDKALEEQDRRKLDSEIRAVVDDVISCEQQLRKSESLFLKTSAKNSIAVRNDISRGRSQLRTLNARREALEKKRVALGGGSVPSRDVQVDESSTTPVANGETERERQIRLGEMTPFGTVVGAEHVGKGLTEFEKYLQSQAQLQKIRGKGKSVKRKAGSSKSPNKDTTQHDTNSGALEVKRLKSGSGDKVSATKKRSPLKKSVLQPKKRRKKETLGSATSSNSWSVRPHGELLSERTELEASGSEYEPSDDDDDDRAVVRVVARGKPRSKTQRKAAEDWATDDSDWESSDEEGIARRRRNSKKCVDDGNVLDYKYRMKVCEEERKKSGEEEDETYHELDMGFRVPGTLWKKLYKYQQVGVQWLWELHQQRCGGILGDEMGLGKTIQVIAFLAGLSVSPVTDRHLCMQGLGPCLIVCPTTVMHQWVKEFHRWHPPTRVAVLHESGSHVGQRGSLIARQAAGCVLITSYAGVVRHKDLLLKRDWHYLVLDEGHKIRNPDAQVTITCKMFRTPHRIILSGSPMQNHLKELWSLFDFIFPGKLGTLPVFLAQLAVPITQGGYANATQVQVATAYRCATVLRDTISPYLLRRLKPDVQSHVQLPSKSEQVLFCRLTDEQRELYRAYLDSGEVARIVDGRTKVFVGLIQLRKICNHPDIYSGGPKLMRGDKEEDLTEEQRYGFWRKAGKMLVVESLLKIWKKQGHRVLLFTQSRQMLCILEAFVLRQGYAYMKLDGGTSIASRQPLIDKFNSDPSVFVFLLTTRVGGLGVNLTGADRVVIYDPDWNPATDTQARERAWRIGQQNQVTVYRLVTAGTIEEKIYHRQIFKQFLTNKVLRDPRQRRFFKTNDLFELFTLKEEDEGGSTETAAIFAGTNSEVKVNMTAKAPRSNKSSYSVAPQRPKPSASSVASGRETLADMKQLAVRASSVRASSVRASSVQASSVQASSVQASNVQTSNVQASSVRASSVQASNSPMSNTEAPDTPMPNTPMPDTPMSNTPMSNTPMPDTPMPDTPMPDTVMPETKKKKRQDKSETLDVSFSATKMERMKRLAQALSQKLSSSVNVDSVVKDDATSDRTSCVIDKDRRSDETNTSDNHKTDLASEELDPTKAKTEEQLQGRKQKPVQPPDRRDSKRDSKRDRSKHKSKRRDDDARESKRDRRERERRELGAKFEGERVPFLVKQRTAKTDKEDADQGIKDDDYVLKKLFKKSGLHEALHHDVIIGEGDADYALVEGEAKRVAQEAVKALKESRRLCWQADTGVPSWTGQSGAINSRPRFGKKSAVRPLAKEAPSSSQATSVSSSPSLSGVTSIPSGLTSSGATSTGVTSSGATSTGATSTGATSTGATSTGATSTGATSTGATSTGATSTGATSSGATSTGATSSDVMMSSAELIARMKQRNRLTSDVNASDVGDVNEEQSELLADIRNFIAFGASVDNTASTREVLDRFADRLPKGMSPLFKCMLEEVSEFHRLATGEGVWKLRTDFRW